MKTLKIWSPWCLITALGWIFGLLAMMLMNLTVVRGLKAFILIFIPSNLSDMSAIDEVLRDNIGDGIPGRFINPYLAFSLGAVFGCIKGAAFGTVGGFAQFLILRRYLPRSARWIGLNAIAWACLVGFIWGHAWAWGWTSTLLIWVEQNGWISAIVLGGIQWIGMRQLAIRSYWLVLSSWSTWWICIHLLPGWIPRPSILPMPAMLVPYSYLWITTGMINGAFSSAWLIQLVSQKESLARSTLR